MHAKNTNRHWLVNTLLVTAAMLLLSGLLSFDNLWPTPLIKPDARVSPEFVMLWALLLVIVGLAGRVPRGLLSLIAAAYTFLVLGRYIDVTAPALFGRPLNLYWDGYQLPRFLAKAAQSFSFWQLGLMVLAIVLVVWLFYRLLRWAIDITAHVGAPAVRQSTVGMLTTAGAIGLVAANYAGVQATWPYVSKPVIPTYVRQVDLLLTALLPSRLAKVLPPSPAFDTNLKALNGADVMLLMFESYGAVTYDREDLANTLAAPRAALAKSAAGAGQSVVSGYITAATIGGASELSHLSLLSGIDLTDPLRHDLLLTTNRPTMMNLFRQHGYEVFGLYPALSWDWPEKSFYGFDEFIDGPALNYPGPHFGLWWIPDQYTIAYFDKTHPINADTPPRLLFFPTITSHAPFRPTPPYQPDWARVLTADPYDEKETASSMAEKVDWTDMDSGYPKTLRYTFQWLTDYVAQERARPQLLAIIGDHQPVGSITGPHARWEVPVHIVSSDAALTAKLIAHGFVPGMTPGPNSLGGMDDLGAMLLDAFHRADMPKTALRGRRITKN